MKGAVYSSRSALYTGLFENGVRRAEKGAECETEAMQRIEAQQALLRNTRG